MAAGVLALSMLIASAGAGHAREIDAADPGTSRALILSPELQYLGAMSANSSIRDSSRHRADGVVATANGGAVTEHKHHGWNSFLRFPGGACATAPCPQAIITPPNSAELTPGDQPFRFGATIRLTEPAAAQAGMNVFQRGAFGVGQSQWKAQVDYGTATCRWSDGKNAVLLPELHDERFKLELNSWYILTCARWPFGIFTTSLIDRTSGKTLAVALTHNAEMGTIVPVGDAKIGGKRVNPAQTDADTDQFHGDLDDIFFDTD